MSPRIQGGTSPRTATRVKVDQPSLAPTSKVTAAGAGAAAGILLVFITGLFGLDMSPEVASAITTLLALVAGYFTRESVPSRVEPRAAARLRDERGQTNVWFLLGALTVGVVVLAVIVLT